MAIGRSWRKGKLTDRPHVSYRRGHDMYSQTLRWMHRLDHDLGPRRKKANSGLLLHPAVAVVLHVWPLLLITQRSNPTLDRTRLESSDSSCSQITNGERGSVQTRGLGRTSIVVVEDGDGENFLRAFLPDDV